MSGLHPEFATHGSFAHLKLGRVRRPLSKKALRFGSYFTKAALPDIPATFDLTAPLASVAWPMYGNDALGDCTIATVGHMIQAWSALAGRPAMPAEIDIITAYWETGTPPSTSGTAGGATDSGRDEQNVLSYWRDTGIANDKIGAYVFVDPGNLDHVRAALYLFEGLYTGIALPVTAQSQSVWDVAGDPSQPGPAQPGSWGGHAVPYLPKWDGSTIQLVTWGHVLTATAAFHSAYTDECWAIVSPDMLDATGKSVAGFDIDALNADLAALSS